MKRTVFFPEFKLSFRVSRGLNVFVFLLLFAMSAVLTPAAHAAGLSVNSLLDTIAVDGKCTLREAIQNANNNAATNADCIAGSGADTITFSVSGTITLAGVLPNITDAAGLTINGTGQTVTISGNNSVRVAVVDVGALLTLNNVTIANGNITGDGGGIYNHGALTITNCTFFGNSAGGIGGGIVNNDNGMLTITNSTFSGNSAGGLGGGGIYNNHGALTITNCTFSGNNTAGDGGGIVNFDTLTVTNSTFSGNSAISDGGGIYTGFGTVTLRNTIVANSTSGGNCSGTITNGGNNIEDGTTCGWGSMSGSKSSTNPMLGPLAGNGGPTQTMALLTGSPAIDGVTFNSPNSAPAADQRGVARPQGSGYDIGAFEGSQQQAVEIWTATFSFSIKATSQETDNSGNQTFLTSNRPFAGTMSLYVGDNGLTKSDEGCYLKFLGGDGTSICINGIAGISTESQKSKSEKALLVGLGEFTTTIEGKPVTGIAYIDAKATLKQDSSNNLISIGLTGKVGGGVNSDFVFAGTINNTTLTKQAGTSF